MIIPAEIGSIVTLGYEGENNAREYHFNIAYYQQAWPDGAPQMLVTRADGENYIADTSVNGDSLVWKIKNSDVSCPGMGSMRIAFVNSNNELLGYTEETTLNVVDMPDWLTSGEVPPAYEPWIASILVAGDAAQTGAANAKKSETNAAASAAIAESGAENAEASAVSANASKESAAASASAAANSAASAAASASAASISAQAAAKSESAADASARGAESSAASAAESKVEANASKNAAASSAAQAAASAASANGAVNAVQQAARTASDAATNAQKSESASASHAAASAASASDAYSSTASAAARASEAANSAAAARASENAAKTYEQGAYTAFASADASKNAASESAELAKKSAEDTAKYIDEVSSAASEQIAAIAQKGTEQKNAVAAKGAEVIASLPADYVDLSNDVTSLKDTKADVIMDESPKAASHVLHAQDGKLGVTLYGQTTETGTGDKSPDNPYTISGVDVARMQAGGKNLVDPDKLVKGYMELNGKFTPSTNERTTDFVLATPGMVYSFSLNVKADITGTAGASLSVCFFDAGKSTIGNRISSASGGTYQSLTLIAPANTRYLRASFRTFGNAEMQVEIGNAPTAYEPYNANVITPPLLPDGAPLMGNGTVCDTIENDVVLHGCDKGIWLTGASSENWAMSASGVFGLYLPDYTTGNMVYSSTHYATSAKPPANGQMYYMDTYYGPRIGFGAAFSTLDEWKAHLAANPMYLAYHSNNYTTEKDLRVCKVTRRWKYTTPSASNLWVQVAAGEARYYCSGIVAGSGLPIACEKFECYKTYSEWTNAFKAGKFAMCIASGVLYVSSPGYDTLEAFKTWWATLGNIRVWYADGSEKVYYTDSLTLSKPEGITPVTVSGSGETAVSYPRDTKDWGKAAASSMIGATESGMVATTNYAIGAFIIDRDSLTLYRATKAIAKGETITPGTNCAATTVVEQLANIYTLLNA